MSNLCSQAQRIKAPLKQLYTFLHLTEHQHDMLNGEEGPETYDICSDDWLTPCVAAPNTRHQGAPDRPGTSSQFSRLPQPAAKPPEVMEFDPNILWKAMGVVPPSFAPVAEDTNHKRSHDQMQVGGVAYTVGAYLLEPVLGVFSALYAVL